MSWGDILYLEVARKLKKKEEFEEKKFLFEQDMEVAKQNMLLLMDIRQICFSNLCFENDSARERYFDNLPSRISDNESDRMKHVAVGRGLRKVKKESKAPE